ncbi:MAG: ABC transporter substrate-binding protein [Rhodospirillales bacterium]|nr:ABC transporter substrate-binding protein [Rhodospirillales bacterium]
MNAPTKYHCLNRRRACLKTIIGAITVGVMASAALCLTSPGALAAPAGEPILIGSINDVTGFAAAYGVPERDGQRLAVKMINDKGGINGRPLQLVERDTQGDANRTVQYFEELASDPKIAAIAGFTTSNDANAVKALANRLKTPMLAFVGAATYTEGDNSYLYRVLLGDLYLMQGILKFMSEDKGGKTFALLMQNDAFGQGAAKVAQQFYEKYRLTLVANEMFAPKDTDVTPQLTRIREKKPDFIISYGVGLVSAVINRNREALGMTGTPLIGPQNWGEASVIQASGASAEGVLVASSMASGDPKKGTQMEVFNLYKEFAGKAPSGAAPMYGMDAIQILGMALAKVAPPNGNVDRVRLRDAINQTDYKGATGHFKFSDAIHEIADPGEVVIGIIEEGKWIQYASRKKK